MVEFEDNKRSEEYEIGEDAIEGILTLYFGSNLTLEEHSSFDIKMIDKILSHYPGYDFYYDEHIFADILLSKCGLDAVYTFKYELRQRGVSVISAFYTAVLSHFIEKLIMAEIKNERL